MSLSWRLEYGADTRRRRGSLRLLRSKARGGLLSVVIPLLLAACDNPGSQPIQFEHPQTDLLPGHHQVSVEKVVRAPESTSSVASSALSSIRDHLSVASESIRIGALDTPVHEVWGRIADVEQRSSGPIYVLDSHFSEIRVFDGSGFRGVIDGVGDGPEGFRQPQALTLTERGNLVVSTGASGLKFYRLSRDVVAEPLRTVRDVAPENVCSIGDTVFVRGRRVAEESRNDSNDTPLPGLVHAYRATDGEWIRSFGEGYGSENGLVNLRMNDGLLTCVDSPATVVVAFHLLPRILGYATDGSPKWITEFQDFRPIELTEYPEGENRGPFRSRIRTGAHRLVSLVGLADGAALVQIVRFGEENPDRPGSFRSDRMDVYIIDGDTGMAEWIPTELPLVVSASSRMIFTQAGQEYPVLAGYNY